MVAAVLNLEIFLSVMKLQAEIEKVKKRREERALEKARHEEEMVSLHLSQLLIVLFQPDMLANRRIVSLAVLLLFILVVCFINCISFCRRS